MNAEEYLEQRLEDQMAWYSRKSAWNQRWHKRSRLLQIALAASIPLLTGVADRAQSITLVVGAFGVVIAVLGGLSAVYKFEENWVGYRATAEALKQQRFRYLTATPPYDGGDAFDLLVQNVEDMLAQEQKRWTEYVRAKKEARPTGEAPATGEADGEAKPAP